MITCLIRSSSLELSRDAWCKGDSGSASSILLHTSSFVGAGTTFGRHRRRAEPSDVGDIRCVTMKAIRMLSVLMVFASGAHVVATPGKGHVTLKGDVNASFDIDVKDCVATRPGDTLASGFMFTIPRGSLIATGVFQVPAYSGDNTYERSPANDKTI